MLYGLDSGLNLGLGELEFDCTVVQKPDDNTAKVVHTGYRWVYETMQTLSGEESMPIA
jgi:hypothetical protein